MPDFSADELHADVSATVEDLRSLLREDRRDEIARTWWGVAYRDLDSIRRDAIDHAIKTTRETAEPGVGSTISQ